MKIPVICLFTEEGDSASSPTALQKGEGRAVTKPHPNPSPREKDALY
jgi:hypothetical protein